jgi:hypothetical protein
MKKQNLKRINPNKCNKKLLEYCQNKIDNGWVEKYIKILKKDSVLNKALLEGTDTSYTYKEYKYARILAGYLPKDIPEGMRVQCVIEGYTELAEQKQIKEQVKSVVDKKKTKFNFKKVGETKYEMHKRRM